LPLALPITLGCDFAGTVDQVGPGHTEFDVGEEVFGYAGVQRDGTYAEYIALPAEHCARKPKRLTCDEAAAMALGSLTAHVALFEEAKLARGQRVLIHAAAGGVGSLAVQLAKLAGATVYATGSEASTPLIRSLGADVVIDYRKEKFEDVARDLDVVLDAMGGKIGARSWACLRPGGFMACIVTPPDPTLMAAHGARGVRAGARPDGETLKRFAEFADAGQLRPIIDRVLPLEQIQEAHRLSEGGHSHGRIVLRVA
jgi:NADPH:quinone reductase-like Zn-dependent oxidoreductase